MYRIWFRLFQHQQAFLHTSQHIPVPSELYCQNSWRSQLLYHPHWLEFPCCLIHSHKVLWFQQSSICQTSVFLEDEPILLRLLRIHRFRTCLDRLPSAWWSCRFHPWSWIQRQLLEFFFRFQHRFCRYWVQLLRYRCRCCRSRSSDPVRSSLQMASRYHNR